MSNKAFLLLSFGFVFLAGGLIFAISQGWFSAADNFARRPGQVNGESGQPPSSTKAKPLSEVLGVEESDLGVIGGVKRPKKDADFVEPKKVDYGDKNPAARDDAPLRVKQTENPYTRTLAKDLSDPKVASKAASSLAASEPFDREKYQQDPDSFLLQTRPARARSGARPSDQVVPLASESALFQSIIAGESVILRAKGTPPENGEIGWPCTFHSNQTGLFAENNLKTISIPFDENGIAEVTFKPSSNTAGFVNVHAASPVYSGSLKYVIRILRPSGS